MSKFFKLSRETKGTILLAGGAQVGGLALGVVAGLVFGVLVAKVVAVAAIGAGLLYGLSLANG
ncbi:MAG TPA: hypothetical protein VM529_12905 [Gemmata sp.]|jgi:hypothetical protein|nr:hypothetical protein [Gemmata sp.]